MLFSNSVRTDRIKDMKESEFKVAKKLGVEKLLIPQYVLSFFWFVVLLTTEHWGMDQFAWFQWFLLICVSVSVSSLLYIVIRSHTMGIFAVKVVALSIFAGVIKACIGEVCIPSTLFYLMTFVSIPVLLVNIVLSFSFLMDRMKGLL